MLGISRSTVYYQPRVNPEDLVLMRLIDEIYTEHPFYGARRIRQLLQERGRHIGRHRVRRLMRIMGLEAAYPKPNLSKPHPGHVIYPYLLRNIVIERPNQVWSADITYIRVNQGWVYLTAVMDWHSRYVLAWELQDHSGQRVLPGGPEQRLAAGHPGDLQHRPGPPVYGQRLHGCSQRADN